MSAEECWKVVRGIFLGLGVVVLTAPLTGCAKSQNSKEPEAAGLLAAAAMASRRTWSVPQMLPGTDAYDAPTHAALTSALLTQPADYQPRSHHKDEDGAPHYTNRLIRESSPYLLQHAHNPVSWYPWGEEAFARARELGRPVFLSVGYSTCHWCHVMEGESFEDEEIASVLNSRFVPIKVDREERPDVDGVYMDAVRLLTGGGGWPMTIVMTPEGEPFFGGTYFPARAGDRGNRAGLLEILDKLATQYETDPATVLEEAQRITKRLQQQARPQPPGDIPTSAAIRRAAAQLLARYDKEWGGFGNRPKFPSTANIDFLLRYHRRSGDEAALAAATGTLDHMAAGGIRDHVGGGFHRYSTDRRWLVPHFEKMLYDNALIAQAYLEAWQVTGDPQYAAVAREILAYVGREMTHEDGAFYSATDADSEVPGREHQEEGWYFTWTPEEIETIVGPDAARLIQLRYGTRAAGNFEGRNIFFAARSLAEVARMSGLSEEALEEELTVARQALYDVRAGRPAPLRDDKILAGWNGLMISAFARGGRLLQDDGLSQRAADAADFLLANLEDDGRLRRAWRAGQAREDAVLDDYAYLIAGLLDLFETTSDPRWLDAAIRLQTTLDEKFADTGGGYFFTASDAETLLTREKPSYDGARPSGNSVALQNLLRLAAWTTDDAYRIRAQRGFAAFAATLNQRGSGSPRMLAGLDFLLDTPKEIILVAPEGSDADAVTQPFREILARSFQPAAVVVVTAEGAAAEALAARVPLVAGKTARSGHATAYVCENRVCDLPTTDPEVFREQLAKTRPYPPG